MSKKAMPSDKISSNVEWSILERVDLFRLDATSRLDDGRRAEMGQFLTPAAVARLMASMFNTSSQSIRLLDAGAGVGSLSAAFVAEMCGAKAPPKDLTVIAYEVDPLLVGYLRDTLEICRAKCRRARIRFVGEIRQEDFINAGVLMTRRDLFSQHAQEGFNCAILNPPYRKIHSESRERQLLRSIGVETGNLYTAFLSIVMKVLDPDGQLVAITPRSFCNGPYFKSFRRLFLETMALRRVHVFESRDRAFQEDSVLQENVIFHAVKGATRETDVIISSNRSPDDQDMNIHQETYDSVVHPGDPDFFIRLATDDLSNQVALRMESFTQTLEDLRIAVSTGRVVDFRATEFLRDTPGKDTAPLIYPGHMKDGFVEWPREGSKKPNAISDEPGTAELLIPSGTYVLVKRFSAKEERRRIVAAVYDPARLQATKVGFENHLNYYHRNGGGLAENFAKGLAAFLNSTLVDSYFRQFSGHTQVNADDLRSLKYPTREQLETLGARIGTTFPRQDELDQLIEESVLTMADTAKGPDPIKAKKKIEEALSILNDLGLPKEQQNERSALTLLALLGLTPEKTWAQASSPYCGITQMMEYFETHYGKKYAPNTRETVRRFTVHQFGQAGLVIANPDKPSRPTNSPKTIYQIEPGVLEVLQCFGKPEWIDRLKSYLTSVETLKKQYDLERKMKRIPIQIAPGKTVNLSPGDHNALTKMILDESRV